MINLRTRIPCSIKPLKFQHCGEALRKLECFIHRELYAHHKNLLDSQAVWTIELHAYDIEDTTGTIKVVLIKSNHHLKETELHYLTNTKTDFFKEEGFPISDWKNFIIDILSVIQ